MADLDNYVVYDEYTYNNGTQDAELFFLENEDVLEVSP